MSSELFTKTRDECAEWLAQKVHSALLTVYRMPFAQWEQASASQRAYCRGVALAGIQHADLLCQAWGPREQDEAAIVKIVSVERVPPDASAYQPPPEYAAYRVTFTDGRHGDVSSPWLVRCAKGWMQNHQPVKAQIIYDKDRPDVARLIDLNVDTYNVGRDRAVSS